jgi:hypothetical protein
MVIVVEQFSYSAKKEDNRFLLKELPDYVP